MTPLQSSKDHLKLTSAEIGKLWATYIGNTLGKCVISYYLNHTEDSDIKNVLQQALKLSESIMNKIKDIFKQENFPIPIGYTEEDVNVDAPRLYEDQFYLHYLRYTSKAGLSIYSIAIPLVTRKDLREFFKQTAMKTEELISTVDKVMMDKGLLVKPPVLPIPDEIDTIKNQSFLNGLFGHIRPLHALEITHLYDNIDNNITSKALLIGFSQVAKDEQVRQFFIRGRKITDNHIRMNSKKMHKDHLPYPYLLDNLVTSSTVAPFSDKLMMAHKIDMFSMKIRSYANAMSLSTRRDLSGMYSKMIMDVGLFVEDGANIVINRGWMEQPPSAIDRNKLDPTHKAN